MLLIDSGDIVQLPLAIATVLLRCNFTLARSTLACVRDYLREGSSQILRVE